MRIVFECYSIYSALLCVVLTGALAINISDEKIEWLATKIVNISFLVYGPNLSTICIYGMRDIKGLSRICTLQGISNHTNFVTIFILFVCFSFSLGVSFTMALEKTLDMAQSSFRNESSILYKISQQYFRYHTRLSHSRNQERARERLYRREEREADQFAT